MSSQTQKQTIWTSDLRKNLYSLDELGRNMCFLDFRVVLRTQTLTAEFCKEYLLNDTNANANGYSYEESYLIDEDYILRYQPHLRGVLDKE